MNTNTKSKFITSVVYYSLLVAIIYFVVKFLFVYLFPFIIGTIITVLVQKPATLISKRTKIRKGYCALGIVALVYLLIISFLSLIIFEVGAFIYNLTISDNKILSDISVYVDRLIESVNNIFDNIPEFISNELSTIIKNVLNSVAQIFTDFSKSIVSSMPMFLTSSLVTIIASCYIAKDYDRFKASILSVVSSKYKTALISIKKLFRESVGKVILGYLKILLITFVELSVGLLLLRVENFLIYAAVIAILDLLPILGTGTVLIPWGVYSILTENYFFGIGVIILYSLIIFIRNVIEPKIIGKQIGLHPLIALIAVFIGLKLFGFIGIFILPFSVMLIYKMYDEGIIDSVLDSGANKISED